MKEMKRVFALILCFVMLLGVLPVGALAAEAETTAPSETEITTQPQEAAADVDDAADIEGETPSEEVLPEEEAAPTEDVLPEEEAAPTEEVLLEEDVTPTEEVIPEDEEPAEEAVLVEEEQIAYVLRADATVTGNQVVFPKDYDVTENLTIYKRVTAPEAGKQYLIVNGGVSYGVNATGDSYAYSVAAADGSEYYLTWNDDPATSTPVGAGNYLTTSSAYLWTAGKNGDYWTFTNGTTKLGMTTYTQSGGCGGGSTTYNILNVGEDAVNTDWTYSGSVLTNVGLNVNLVYSNSYTRWAGDDSNYQVYFYEKVDVTRAVVNNNSGGTYAVSGADQIVAAMSGTAVTVTSQTTWTPNGTATLPGSDWVTTYTVVSDESDIFSTEPGTNGQGGVLSGNPGVATLRVTVSSASEGVTITDDFTVTAKEIVPEIEIVEVGSYDAVDDIIIIKGQDEMKDGYYLDAWAFYDDADTGVKGDIMPAPNTITWELVPADSAVATLVPVTEDDVTLQDSIYVQINKEGQVQVRVVYTYADGKSVDDYVTFSISSDDYYIPSDGTDDFPEYPAEGAVRINKTATGLGAFSQTGVAQVELSMAGVPYGTKPVDVVIMVDMSSSMNKSSNEVADRVTPAKTATINAIKKLVINEAGAFNENRVAVYSFAEYLNADGNNGYFDLDTIDSETELQSLIGTQNAQGNYTGGIINNWRTYQGTSYNVALQKCEEVLRTNKIEGRQQFCIFITDGAPTTGFAYVGSNGAAVVHSYWDTYGDNPTDAQIGSVYGNRTEYYSQQMKNAGVQVYSIGIQLYNDSALTQESTNARTLLKKIAGTKAINAETQVEEVVNATNSQFEKYAKFVGANVSELDTLFQNIVGEILEAATDIEVHDIVGEDYSLVLSNPGTLTTDQAGQLKIEVIEYKLDANKNRIEPGTPIETITANSSGVTTDANGKMVITAENFTYNEAEQKLVWTADKLSNTELAIRYYVYLDGAKDNSVPAGTYPTNESAYITYTNYKGNECKKDFPVPQMTWQGAQVTYKFYLVNEQGQPVNRAGRVIPFNEAVYVTEGVTIPVTWNQEEGAENMLAEDLLAYDVLPEVYTLYDPQAYYEIRVYQHEGANGEFTNYNYFKISGAADKLIDSELDTDTTVNNSTTKVYNTTSGVKYDQYGVYSAQPKDTVLDTTNDQQVTVEYQTTNIDYANTTVAFAVKWNKALKPDTVIMDSGLDVVINVATNDALECEIAGVLATSPSGVDMNVGIIPKEQIDGLLENAGSATIPGAGGKPIGTATLEPGATQAVRFTLHKDNGMTFTQPAKFFYVSAVKYYSTSSQQITDHMYSQVTVIPATSVYYEDEYVNLYTYTKVGDDYETKEGWTVNSKAAGALQGVERPGENEGFGKDYDANMEYGNDTAYDSSSTYSMGEAAMVTVKDGMYATAEFSFFGTGFDVISMTDSTTGFITVEVLDANGNPVDKYGNSITETNTTAQPLIRAVDTYYGYTWGLYKATYEWDGYNWFLSNVEAPTQDTADSGLEDREPGSPRTTQTIHEYMWQPAPNTANKIYQVPVIKINGLAQKNYKAIITVAHSPWLDHAPEADGSYSEYNFYLDAIRIYDPMVSTTIVDGNTTAGDIYVSDGEGYPKYTELRDILLNKNDFDAVTEGNQTEGAIFIDDSSNTSLTKTYSIQDYANYGPNNEVYLAPGQTVAFKLDLSGYTAVADVQIGMKSANGKHVYATMGINGSTTNPAKITEGTSSTDRYYSIGKYVNKSGPTIISFTNSAAEGTGALLSITNLKLTFTQATTVTAGTYTVSKEVANTVLKMLNTAAAEAEKEETVVLADADMEVSVNKSSVKEGGNVTVKVTTSDAVESLTVNDQETTSYKVNKKTGKRTWTVKVKAEEAGELVIAVTAYDAEGNALDTVSETVEVTAKNPGKGNNLIDQLLDKLFG